MHKIAGCCEVGATVCTTRFLKNTNFAHIGDYLIFINNLHKSEKLKRNILLHISSVTKEAVQRVALRLRKRVHALLGEENITST
jgi:hypothetical protein